MLTAFLLTLILFSCQKEELVVNDQDFPEQEYEVTETVLGEKLENPYTVANMQKAYENLKQSTQLKSSVSITTTDYYVRFFPKTDEELQVLEADSLTLFDYPLDYEIEQIGEMYIDPEVNPEDGQWYYTSVPVDYKFPNVEYEILADLFLPESVEDDEDSELKSTSDTQFLNLLEDEALRITGNYTEPNENTGSMLKAAKKNPTGYVRVYDSERATLVGVEGVRVRTRRWFSYGYAWTSSTGYYRIDRSYRRDVHYCLFFVNSSGFKIRASTLSLWKAKHHVGKHNRSGYDFNIYQNSRAWRFCTVNNAVVKYRKYCDQFNIGKPHDNLRIVASDKSGGGAAPMLKHVWGFVGFTSKSKVVSFLGKIAGLPATILNDTFFKFVLPDIIIKANSGQGTAAVYETCFHELAHASHFKKVGGGFWIKYINYIVTYGAYGTGEQNNAGLCALGEAWGYHMGYRLTLEEFRNVGSSTNNSVITWNGFEKFEPLETGSKDDYLHRYVAVTNGPVISWDGWIPAGIMNDIIDTNTDWVRSGFRDNVSGYTHQDLFDALDSDVDTPQKFRNRLLSENGNRDKADLEDLFEAYYWN